TIRHPAEQNNCVLRNNVVNGLDVRGTLMLRNIPNKMDYLSLLAILNEYCFGMYDFAYLRKDFKTGLNVGYGFVNFCHTDGVLAILDNMANRRWAGHASNRPCEVSYATVQGLDALVNKFRNSSVMKEPESSKPHLFVTYEEALIQGSIALVGTQIPFPAPNNATKLHRSEESKVQYGLYPPHHGGNAVAHRNRNSQYDHGNP
ncbi:RNA recognition motif 2-domain-containing protein, partial [Clohesyomyces aquaticus]